MRERDLRVRTLRASIGRVLTAPSAGWFTLGGWSRPSVQIEAPSAITEVGIIRDGSLIAGIQSLAGTLESQAAYIAANLTDALADWDAGSEIFSVSIPAGAGITLRVLYFSGTNLEASGDSLEQQTGSINFNADTSAFAAAVGQSFGAIAELSSPVAGCWVFRTDGQTPPLIAVTENRLNPISFVRSRRWVQNEQTWFEIRLIQAPLAFNDGHERVLPEPPTVRRIREGSAGNETEPPVNELQALRLPPDFRGTYFLRWNYRISKLLGIEDGPDEIAAALNAMFESGKRFEVTNPEPDNAYVEFIGRLSGAAQTLITVEVNTFAPGVLTFTLPLDRAEMATALRSVAEIEVPFEVEAEIVDDGEDIADPAVTGRTMTLFQQPVKVVREQIWEELDLIQNMDWLRPPQPRDYIPFTPDQIIFGVQHYVAVFGDGELRSFSFAHNLGTEAIHLTVREKCPRPHDTATTALPIFPENNPSLSQRHRRSVLTCGQQHLQHPASRQQAFALAPITMLQYPPTPSPHPVCLRAVRLTPLQMALIDRLKYDGPGGQAPWLVYKHPSESLVLGTQLIVSKSQEAIFFKGGNALDVFGPGTHTLATANIPLLQKLVNLPFGGKTPFTAEIYFVNKAAKLDMKWGTPDAFQVTDPRYQIIVNVRAYGQFGVKIADGRNFTTQIVGTLHGDGVFAYDTVARYFKGVVTAKVKAAIADMIVREKVSLLDITSHLDTASTLCREKIAGEFDRFGLEVLNFYVESVNVPEADLVKLKKILEDCAEFDVLGDERYTRKRSFDVMETGAANEGAGGAAMSAGLGLGMGFGAGAAAGDLSRQLRVSPAETTVACSKCKAANPAGAKFCQSCGESMQAPKAACPACKAENPAGAKFCHECGAALGARKCPKCAHENPPAAKFCGGCGQPFQS